MIKCNQEGDQSYSFSSHEFRDITAQKAGHSFKLRYHKRKSESGLVRSLNARDLLSVLKSSDKAHELSLEGIYEFELDPKFVLHCRYESVPVDDE